MSSLDVIRAQIERLDGQENYPRWKRQVTLVLKHHKVLDVVEGTVSTRDDSFESKDALAQLILISSLNSVNEELTSSCKTAKEVWDKLISVYEQSSSQRLDRLLEKFFSNDGLVSGSDIVTQVARLQKDFNALNIELKNNST